MNIKLILKSYTYTFIVRLNKNLNYHLFKSKYIKDNLLIDLFNINNKFRVFDVNFRFKLKFNSVNKILIIIF